MNVKDQMRAVDFYVDLGEPRVGNRAMQRGTGEPVGDCVVGSASSVIVAFGSW